MTVGNLAGGDIRPPKDDVLGIRDIRHYFGRADTARTQPQRGYQLAKAPRRQHEKILADLRHPSAAHVVAYHHSSALAGEIHRENGCAPDERHRVGLPRREFVQAFTLQHPTHARRALRRGDHPRSAHLETLVRGNREADHFSFLPPLTDAIALRSACALLRVSSHSRSGTESATIPAPAWTEAVPLEMKQVRMVIARSMREPPALI